MNCISMAVIEVVCRVHTVSLQSVSVKAKCESPLSWWMCCSHAAPGMAALGCSTDCFTLFLVLTRLGHCQGPRLGTLLPYTGLRQVPVCILHPELPELFKRKQKSKRWSCQPEKKPLALFQNVFFPTQPLYRVRISCWNWDFLFSSLSLRKAPRGSKSSSPVGNAAAAEVTRSLLRRCRVACQGRAASPAPQPLRRQSCRGRCSRDLQRSCRTRSPGRWCRYVLSGKQTPLLAGEPGGKLRLSTKLR